MRYIDCHVHTFPDAVAPKAVGRLAKISNLTPCTDGTLPDTLQKMNERGVECFFNLNIATNPAQQTKINDTASLLNQQYPGQIYSFGSIHFLTDNAVEEVARVRELGLPGIKMHPDYQEFFIDDPRLYPVYEACAEQNVPIVFHAGWDCYSPDIIHAPPERSAVVAKRFPKLRMVLAHLGGLRQWEAVQDHLAGLENVYFDTAMIAQFALPQELALSILNRHPRENIFLGSDCPWEDPLQSIRYVEALPIGSDFQERIFHQNAEAFLAVTTCDADPSGDDR